MNNDMGIPYKILREGECSLNWSLPCRVLLCRLNIRSYLLGCTRWCIFQFGFFFPCPLFPPPSSRVSLVILFGLRPVVEGIRRWSLPWNAWIGGSNWESARTNPAKNAQASDGHMVGLSMDQQPEATSLGMKDILNSESWHIDGHEINLPRTHSHIVSLSVMTWELTQRGRHVTRHPAGQQPGGQWPRPPGLSFLAARRRPSVSAIIREAA